jgi:hypothetical protein
LTYADSGFVVSLYLTTEGTSAQARKEVKRTSKPGVTMFINRPQE